MDGQTLEMFERDLAGNLYRIWNRMSSGTYFPPPVRAVPIPKKTGGERILGVPTVSDRIAQMVVKQAIEPKLRSPSSCPTPMVTDRENRPWMPWVLHVSGAGSTTGYGSSTSKACLTIFRMISC